MFVGERPGLVVNDLGSLSVDAVVTYAEVSDPDVVLVGGGAGQQDRMADDGPLIEWLRIVDRTTPWTTSVCTGRVRAGRRARRLSTAVTTAG
ncbi:hypothetical protein [Micromonospora humida]|uniref:hypothetical protein n=1 Tax=Micromonospora humida TaxID=2809018 RepID=UPI00341ABA5D